MGRAAAISGAVVLVLVAVLRMIPWATEQRLVIAGSPSLGGFYSSNPVPLPPRRSACVDPVPLTPDAQRAQIVVQAGKRGVPLELEARAPGYRARGSVPATPPQSTTPVSLPIQPAPPRDLQGTICITNRGHATVNLVGTQEPRSVVAAVTTVEGKEQPDLQLTLYSASTSSVLGHLGTTIDHAAALTGMLPAWLAWVLFVLAFIGIPVAALWAIALRPPPGRP